MRIWIWGIGRNYTKKVEPYDYLISKNMLAGYIVDGSENINVEELDRDVIKAKDFHETALTEDMIQIVSLEKQAEIMDCAESLGITKNRILPYEFLYPVTTELYNEAFRIHFETENISIVKNWYICEDAVSGTTKKCIILSVREKTGYRLSLSIFPQGVFGTGYVKLLARLIDVQDDRKVCEGIVDANTIFSTEIERETTIYRLEVEGLCNVYLRVWLKDVLGEELRVIGNPMTRDCLRWELSRINDLGYHDTDYSFIRVFRDFSEFTIIDVGANLGQTSMSFLEHSTMDVLAFEPNPILCEALSFLSERYNGRMKVYDKGVGEVSGELEFYIPRHLSKERHHQEYAQESSFSKQRSIYSVERDLGVLVDDENFEEYISTKEIAVIPLDLAIKEKIKPILITKIDAETFEDKVIRGMTEIIKKYKPLLLLEFNSYLGQQEILGYVSGISPYRVMHWDPISDIFVKENVISSINYFLIPEDNKYFRVNISGKVEKL